MIVCDANVTLLALVRALQRSPETLVTTPGQYFRLMVSLHGGADTAAGAKDPVRQYIEYIQLLHPELADAMALVAADPPQGVVQIAETATHVMRASELACEWNLEYDAAFLFAIAESRRASLLHSDYHADVERYAEVGRALGLVVERIAASDFRIVEARRTNEPTQERRRPIAIAPS